MRFFRRLGGAVRGAIAGGAALAGRLRRPLPAQPGRTSQPGCIPPAQPGRIPPAQPGRTPPTQRGRTQPAQQTPAPAAPRPPRRPRAVAPAQPTRLGWLARWFGRRPGPKAGPCASGPDAGLFTAATHPHLNPEVRAFFNTPIKDCDPELLRLVLIALAHQIAGDLGPSLGMDAQTLFSTLCGRLGMDPGAAERDEAPGGEPVQAADAPPVPPTDAAADAPPAPPADAATDAPLTPTDAAADTPPAPPADTALDAPPVPPADTAPDAPPTPPGPPSASQVPASADAPMPPGAMRQSMADVACPPERPHPGDNRGLLDRSRPCRDRRRPPVRRRDPRLHRTSRTRLRRLPPSKLAYAACAGPP